MMDSVGRITLAARKGRGKDAAKEVYIAAFPVLARVSLNGARRRI